MKKAPVFGSLGILGVATIIFGLHTAGWLPFTQAQGEELKQVVQGKQSASEAARHLVLFYQGKLTGEMNKLANAEFQRDRDPENVEKREAVTDARIAVDATRVELRNQNRIWKGSD